MKFFVIKPSFIYTFEDSWLSMTIKNIFPLDFCSAASIIEATIKVLLPRSLLSGFLSHEYSSIFLAWSLAIPRVLVVQGLELKAS